MQFMPIAFNLHGTGYLSAIRKTENSLVCVIGLIYGDSQSKPKGDVIWLNASVQDFRLAQRLADIESDFQHGRLIFVDFMAEYLRFDAEFFDAMDHNHLVHLQVKLTELTTFYFEDFKTLVQQGVLSEAK